jgi:hypothetical protein
MHLKSGNNSTVERRVPETMTFSFQEKIKLVQGQADPSGRGVAQGFGEIK